MAWREEITPGSRLRLALICLRIAAVLLFLAAVPVGAAVVLLSLEGNNLGVGLSLLLVTLLVVGGEWALTTVKGLASGQKWARDSAIFLFGLCALAVVFVPVGAVGLWALVSAQGRAEFEEIASAAD